MDPNNETENSDYSFEFSEDEVNDESTSVDDFIKELEAKEKDLHITADTTFIEIASEFEDGELSQFLQPEPVVHGPQTVLPAAAEQAAPPASENIENEITDLKDRISIIQAERSELFENSQRRSKDFEAYKARTERERRETFQKQLSNLATKMLPVLDNLDRALKFASQLPKEQQSEFEQFFDGIVLVNQQLNEVLGSMGIDPIMTVGLPFDPHVHEAVAIDETGDYPANVISEELLRGFRIGDNIIRHSMVKVSQSPAAGEPLNNGASDVYGEIDFSDSSDETQLSDPTDVPEDPANISDDE